ncbi:TonB-dependent receptor plug domain-containing protein [Niabella hibiscisoli]|uniref:TonB-dependent receptor plug domain-containing protein n=1 Tax=Niabella hibiscisoli TaxID=1825928 RepID=UPI001F117A95|nr:TonB-dependent receptor plug domain-containing protein [Niabella hibiscisoli]MCH5714892.1 TonB-dependent receptor plug domain-containing protein [Niabella hibiscisoli]
MTLIVYEKKGRLLPFLKSVSKTGAFLCFALFFVFHVKAENVFIEKELTVKTTSYHKSIFKTITGQVINQEGNPVDNAVVSVKGRSAASVTAGDGSFTIEANEGDELIVSHASYITQTITVTQAVSITITLQQNVGNLDQIVVTGYTEYAKRNSPSASTQVNAADINKVPMSTLDQILQGRVPGMSVISSSGQPGQSAAVVIRGIGSINGSTSPLYIMDGIPIESGYFQTINPEDIESVTVLKDASAKALYGSRGSNGVIVVTTKKGKKVV